jgi:hypothetical protein
MIYGNKIQTEKINGDPVLCFFNVRLKPDIGQKGALQSSESDKSAKQDFNSKSNEPPPEEILF